MVPLDQSIDELRVELRLARLKVIQLEDELAKRDTASKEADQSTQLGQPKYPLTKEQYQRYGRQMILPSVGLQGQLGLARSRILVVGAGGLGCPVLMYLAAAGVGHITILDHDNVDLSNLHRQVLHSEATVGINKAESARQTLARLNSSITLASYPLAFTPSLFATPSASTPPTPPQLLTASFDLILDCTDNPATRHFLNAYAVAHTIPLVSGGAVRTEGTVGVYGLPLAGAREVGSGSEGGASGVHEVEYGPCYGCLFPPPPAREEVSDEQAALQGTGACSDEGVLGVLCGLVGLLMATEAIKVLLNIAKPTVHLLAPLSPTPVRTLKIRPRKPACPACSHPDPSTPSPAERWAAFVSAGDGAWPGWEDPLCALPGPGERHPDAGETRVSPKALREALTGAAGKGKVRVIDTRPAVEFGIAHVEGSENIPLARLLRDPAAVFAGRPRTALDADGTVPVNPGSFTNQLVVGEAGVVERATVYLICRRGNDSVVAARALRRHLAEAGVEVGVGGTTAGTASSRSIGVVDVKGGLVGWARDVDDEFPVY